MIYKLLDSIFLIIIFLNFFYLKQSCEKHLCTCILTHLLITSSGNFLKIELIWLYSIKQSLLTLSTLFYTILYVLPMLVTLILIWGYWGGHTWTPDYAWESSCRSNPLCELSVLTIGKWQDTPWSMTQRSFLPTVTWVQGLFTAVFEESWT